MQLSGRKRHETGRLKEVDVEQVLLQDEDLLVDYEDATDAKAIEIKLIAIEEA